MNVKKNLPLLFLLFICIFSTPVIHGQELAVIDSLKKELHRTQADTSRVNLLNKIGGRLLQMGNYNQALPYLLAAKKLAEELDYPDGLATSLNRIGIMHMDKNEYKLSLAYYLQALEVRRKMGDLHGTADVVSNIGIVFSAQGEYPQALHYYLLSLEIREAIHDGLGIGTSFNLIANIYFLQKKYTKALEYYLLALKIREVTTDQYVKAVVISNIGITYIYLGNYQEALKYFKQALEIDEKIGDKEGIANSYTNIGEVLLENKNYTEALTFFNKGLRIFEEINSKRGICETYASLGKTYSELGENKKALACFEQQLLVAQEIGSKLNISSAYLSISNHYKKMNDYKQAYAYYTLFKQTEDDLHSESATKAMNEMEIKYNTQKKEIEIQTLLNEKYQREIDYHQQQQMTYGFIVLLVLLSLVLFFLFNRRRIRKKHLLERQNFEIQLKALSEQMNPHFIFNSLNSIMEFIRTSEKEAALKYLTKFSRLIRLVLESSGKKSVSLVTETELLKLYMELENLRFGGIFTYSILVDKNIDLYNTEIPPLIIQPFIENSILHGIQNKLKTGADKNYTGKITLSMHLQNEFLSCTITDNGIGRKKALEIKHQKLSDHQSLGMRITKDRLGMLSQNRCKIEWIDLVDENDHALGTEVKILIPLIDPFQ